MSAGGTIRVEVVYAAAPHALQQASLQIPEGATVLDALRASGFTAALPAAELDALRTGIWSKACEPGTVLRDQDRVELYRPLLVDPKEARRQRYRRDGIKRPPRGG